MANRQMIGDKVSLKDGPKTMLPDNHKMGSYEFVGDKVKLQNQPSTVKYGASTPNGTMQMIGDKVDLQSKTYTGMNNAPGSDRASQGKKSY